MLPSPTPRGAIRHNPSVRVAGGPELGVGRYRARGQRGARGARGKGRILKKRSELFGPSTEGAFARAPRRRRGAAAAAAAAAVLCPAPALRAAPVSARSAALAPSSAARPSSLQLPWLSTAAAAGSSAGILEPLGEIVDSQRAARVARGGRREGAPHDLKRRRRRRRGAGAEMNVVVPPPAVPVPSSPVSQAPCSSEPPLVERAVCARLQRHPGHRRAQRACARREQRPRRWRARPPP